MKQPNAFFTATPRFLSLIFLGLFLSVSVCLFAQDGAPYYTKSLEGLNIQEVEVTTSGGSIQVMNEPGQKLRLEVFIKGNNGKELSKSDIEQRLNERYEMVIETSDNRVKAFAKQKSNWTDWKNSLSISFKIYVPAKVNSKLKTSGGSMSLKGLDGTQDFSTSGGSLKVEAMKGPLNGRTSGGSITVKGAEGNIQMKTSGGSISASDCKGQVVLTTSGGSIKLNNMQGNVEVKTSGGSITGDNIGGELIAKTSGGGVKLTGIRGSVDAGTSGGSMTVDVQELGKYVKLKTSAGSIDLSIPKGQGISLDLSGTKVNAPGLGNFSGSVSNNELNGTINGGGIPVNARASGGSVRLSLN